MPASEADLARRALELVDIPSVSRDEAAVAAYVAHALPLAPSFSDGESFLFRTPQTGLPLVVLAGHTDTVPEQENLPGRLEDGVLHGLGASDMKGGLAVMIELARWAETAPELAFDLGFLFFPREELPQEESPLPGVFDACPELLAAALVVLLEPTANAIQAGCTGNLNARLVFEGESAHSARPWLGRNAIDLAAAELARLLPFDQREVTIDGLRFVEVLSATRIAGGIADNVIPDRVEVNLNYRYAPDRTAEDAERRIRELAPGAAVVSNSPPGRVVAGAPLVERLRGAGELALEPKQAWTNVADFTSRGVDAVNFGPGDPRFAHRGDEQVEVAALGRCFETLQRFASGSV
ncbi:MAG: succinyl-diaminopimelate desuccinylase [Gaiellaceae bacterium]